MLRGRDVLKRPVVTRDTGEKVGQVHELVIDRHGSQVLGLIVGQQMIFGSPRVVRWQDVRSMGMDNVIVESKASVVKPTEAPDIAEVLDQGLVVAGSRLQTTAGRELGKIENVFFDPETGSIVGFQLTGGANKQHQSGSSFLPATPSFEAGKTYSFVDPAAADTIQDLDSAVQARGKTAARV